MEDGHTHNEQIHPKNDPVPRTSSACDRSMIVRRRLEEKKRTNNVPFIPTARLEPASSKVCPVCLLVMGSLISNPCNWKRLRPSASNAERETRSISLYLFSSMFQVLS